MKKILGLDLGTTSIGWAIVNEAENEMENSSILGTGVRVNPLSTDEKGNFVQGKALTTNADRTLKRSMRRNLQRFKLRRETLIKILKDNRWITDTSILAENGNHSTFETYRLRAKSVTEKINLEELARVLLMINKKRGYKSSRKVQSGEDGKLLDGMGIAKKMYEEKLSPGQIIYDYLKAEKKVPEFYSSDLQNELQRIWEFQKKSNEQLTDSLYNEIQNKGGKATFVILRNHLSIVGKTIKGKPKEVKIEKCKLRIQALNKPLDVEDVVIVIQDINEEISKTSGYLGNISDRSKVLFFEKKLSVSIFWIK